MNKIKDSDYHFEYQAEPIQEDEQVLYDHEFDTSKDSLNMILQINQNKLTDEVKKKIFNGFGQQAIESTGINGLREDPISFEIFNGTEFVGAIVVQSFWEQLHIKYLFVEKNYRNQGIARLLINHALEFGIKRGYNFAFVETMSFQAPEFYQKMGFTIEFSRAGYAENTTFHYLKKFLNE